MKPLQSVTGTSPLCPRGHAFWKTYTAAYSLSAQRRTSDAHAANDAAMNAVAWERLTPLAVRSP